MRRTHVGNDVIDLQDPAVRGKTTHTRFLERVLAPSERAVVSAAADPGQVLWTCWGAKEAAYKVVSKLRGEPPLFVHRSFVTTGTTVAYERWSIPFHVAWRNPVLHVVAATGADPALVTAGVARVDEADTPWDAPLDVLLDRFTAREADAIHSLASAAVRLGARAALADAMAVAERRLEIVCAPGFTGRRPPAVLLDGKVAPADVSLSHHGGWIGWAIVA